MQTLCIKYLLTEDLFQCRLLRPPVPSHRQRQLLQRVRPLLPRHQPLQPDQVPEPGPAGQEEEEGAGVNPEKWLQFPSSGEFFTAWISQRKFKV